MDQRNFDLFTKKQEKEPGPKKESARQKRYDEAAALFNKKPDAGSMGEDYKLKCCKCNAVKRAPLGFHFAYGDHPKSFQCKSSKQTVKSSSGVVPKRMLTWRQLKRLTSSLTISSMGTTTRSESLWEVETDEETHISDGRLFFGVWL